jgi:hypothetical protein
MMIKKLFPLLVVTHIGSVYASLTVQDALAQQEKAYAKELKKKKLEKTVLTQDEQKVVLQQLGAEYLKAMEKKQKAPVPETSQSMESSPSTKDEVEETDPPASLPTFTLTSDEQKTWKLLQSKEEAMKIFNFTLICALHDQKAWKAHTFDIFLLFFSDVTEAASLFSQKAGTKPMVMTGVEEFFHDGKKSEKDNEGSLTPDVKGGGLSYKFLQELRDEYTLRDNFAAWMYLSAQAYFYETMYLAFTNPKNGQKVFDPTSPAYNDKLKSVLAPYAPPVLPKK